MIHSQGINIVILLWVTFWIYYSYKGLIFSRFPPLYNNSVDPAEEDKKKFRKWSWQLKIDQLFILLGMGAIKVSYRDDSITIYNREEVSFGYDSGGWVETIVFPNSERRWLNRMVGIKTHFPVTFILTTVKVTVFAAGLYPLMCLN